MTVQEMLKTHPNTAQHDRDALARCVDECFGCSATCTSCADACLGEPNPHDLVRCIRMCSDCADLCTATGRIVVRQTATDISLVQAAVGACAAACRACAQECEQHANHHEHCRFCAEACRRCEQACNDLLATIA